MTAKFVIITVVQIAIFGFCIAETNTRIPKYCAEMKSALKNYNMTTFINIVNDQYMDQYSSSETFPKSNEQCRDTLNIILTNCNINTTTDNRIKRLWTHKGGAWENETIYVEAGNVDIWTRNNSDFASLAVKLRYDKCRACVPFQQLLKYLELPGYFKDLSPDEITNILALSFNAKGNPAIDDWISILYRNGEIIDAQDEAPCLRTPQFSHLKYNNRTVLEYFKNSS